MWPVDLFMRQFSIGSPFQKAFRKRKQEKEQESKVKAQEARL